LIKPPTVPVLEARFLPASTESRKLMLVLHGRGDSMEGFTWLPGEMSLPGLNYLFLNAPDPYFDVGYSWYDLPPNQAPGILRSRKLLFDVLDALVEQGWRSEDIVIFGFSQGCLMSIDVGLRYARRLGGICGISGYMYFPEQAADEAQPHAKEMPWLITHGTRDEILPLGPTEQHVKLLQDIGIPVEWHVYNKTHTIDPARELPLIRNWIAARLEEKP
jgi:phospholipase/carboxylesterase